MSAPACRLCGCTEERACPLGCSWAEPDLCSACVELLAAPHADSLRQHLAAQAMGMAPAMSVLLTAPATVVLLFTMMKAPATPAASLIKEQARALEEALVLQLGQPPAPAQPQELQRWLSQRMQGEAKLVPVTPLQAWCAVGLIQLLLRHPTFDPSAHLIIELGEQLQRLVPPGPMRAVARLGWDPNYDTLSTTEPPTSPAEGSAQTN